MRLLLRDNKLVHIDGRLASENCAARCCGGASGCCAGVCGLDPGFGASASITADYRSFDDFFGVEALAGLDANVAFGPAFFTDTCTAEQSTLPDSSDWTITRTLDLGYKRPRARYEVYLDGDAADGPFIPGPADGQFASGGARVGERVRRPYIAAYWDTGSGDSGAITTGLRGVVAYEPTRGLTSFALLEGAGPADVVTSLVAEGSAGLIGRCANALYLNTALTYRTPGGAEFTYRLSASALLETRACE
jgi:hypothetical protein